MDENRIEEFDEGFDVSAPDDAGKTLKRLWSSVSDQHRRLLIVLVSVIFYTLLSIVAPLYSADIVDLLWEKIKSFSCRRSDLFHHVERRRKRDIRPAYHLSGHRAVFIFSSLF